MKKQSIYVLLFKNDGNWIWLRREKLKRETESILITAENYFIGSTYIKAKLIHWDDLYERKNHFIGATHIKQKNIS